MTEKKSDVWVPANRARPISIIETEFARLDNPDEELKFYQEIGKFVSGETGKEVFAINVIATKKTIGDCLQMVNV